ncbi:MAG: L-threonylcarbamoyladenylate synthase [Eubacteriales bacterium]
MNTRIITLSALSEPEQQTALRAAASVIRTGGLVAFPTETVYGLGADGTREDAAALIFAAKGRPADNPLILHVAHPEDAALYAHLPPLYHALAAAFMPGPLTVVLEAKESVPARVRAGLPTVAVRCPAHPVAHALIALAGVAIAAPSANLSGSPSPTRAAHVIADMQGRVDMILDGGDCEIGLESTIVKLTAADSLQLLRPGAVTLEQLRQICPRLSISPAVLASLKETDKVESPGMKYRHYAPKAPLILLNGTEKERQKFLSSQKGPFTVLAYDHELDPYVTFLPRAHIFLLGEAHEATTHARRLFSLLREADLPGIDAIYAPLPEMSGIGLALYNRLIRAAAHHIITPEGRESDG